MTTITDLPMDLVEEIVSRVPLKSMRKVRLACKNWSSITISESFAKMYISKAATTREGESQIIAVMDYNFYLVSLLVDNQSTEIIGKLKLTCLNEQVKISQNFQCEGSLLCILKEDDTKVMVWNPYWGQPRWIECRYSHRQNGYDIFSYALGYENKKTCRSHKFLREEKLAVLLQNREGINYFEVEIWITTKIKADNVLWSKFLTFNMDPKCPIASTFFIDEEKKVVMGTYERIQNQYSLSITGEGGYFEVLDLGEHADNSCWEHACSYVPSLVQIKESTKGQKKHQSDLEKRRFDENMLRLVALEERDRLRRAANTKQYFIRRNRDYYY